MNKNEEIHSNGYLATVKALEEVGLEFEKLEWGDYLMLLYAKDQFRRVMLAAQIKERVEKNLKKI
jgi:uncharacterized protein (DUF4213/DUF364 family)